MNIIFCFRFPEAEINNYIIICPIHRDSSISLIIYLILIWCKIESVTIISKTKWNRRNGKKLKTNIKWQMVWFEVIFMYIELKEIKKSI